MSAFAWIAVFSLVCACNAHPAQNDAADTMNRARYAVIKEYSLTGVHNVRWETSPMKYLDAEGKPMGFGMVGSKNPSPGCVDVLGKTQSEGVEYERPSGKFKYICKNGQEDVVGMHIVSFFMHKCESHPNGSVIYSQEPSCAHGGKEYRVGEEVMVGFLRLQCQEHGYKVNGCFYLDESNNPVPMNAGETREAGKATHFCEEKGNTLQYYAKSSQGCTKQGKEYKEGDTFSQNHLRYKCSNGIADITGCYINETRDLGIGQDVVENKMVYRCYRLGGKIEYSEYACGFNGTPSCTPEPIPETPDDVPQLGRGLMSPGFGSFAVVQQGDGGNVASPSTLKLQLDKAVASQMGSSH
ncbi:hypothetical protein Ddc_03244 [Ditylenchus destructor]|nr:hypothetical protein Ddc_03244 [Ditylenchus destructor]